MGWSLMALLAGCPPLVWCFRHTLRAVLWQLFIKTLSRCTLFAIWMATPCLDAASEAEFASFSSLYMHALRARGIKGDKHHRSLHTVWRACNTWTRRQRPKSCYPIRVMLEEYMKLVKAHTCELDLLFAQRTLLGARTHDHIFGMLLSPMTQFPEIRGSQAPHTLEFCERASIDNCFALLAVMFAHSTVDTLRREGTLEKYLPPEYPEFLHKPHFHPKIITLACKLLLLPPEERLLTHADLKPFSGPAAPAWYLSLLHTPGAISCQSELFVSADTQGMTYAALNDSECMRSLLSLLQHHEDERTAAVAALTLRTLVLHARTHPHCRPLMSHLVNLGAAKPIASALLKRCKGPQTKKPAAQAGDRDAKGRGQKLRVQLPLPGRQKKEESEREPPFIYHRLQCCSEEEQQLVTVAALCATLRAAAMQDPLASWPDGLLTAYLVALVELMDEDNGGVLQLALTTTPGSTEEGTLCACDLPLCVRAHQASKILIRRPGVMTRLVWGISHPVNNADELPDAAVPALADIMQFFLDMLAADPVTEGLGLLVNIPCDQLLARLHAVMSTLLKIVIETFHSAPRGAAAPHCRALSVGARLFLSLLQSPAAMPLNILHPGNPLCLDSPALRASLAALAQKPTVVTALRVASCLQPGSVLWGGDTPPEFGPRVPSSMDDGPASMPPRGPRPAPGSGESAAAFTHYARAPPSSGARAPGSTRAPPSSGARAPGSTRAPPSSGARTSVPTRAPPSSGAPASGPMRAPPSSSTRAHGTASAVRGGAPVGGAPVSSGAPPPARAEPDEDHRDPGLRALAHAMEVHDVLNAIAADCGGTPASGAPVSEGPPPRAPGESAAEARLRVARDRAPLAALKAGTPSHVGTPAAHTGPRHGSSSATDNSTTNNSNSRSSATIPSPPGVLRPGFLTSGPKSRAQASEVRRSSAATTSQSGRAPQGSSEVGRSSSSSSSSTTTTTTSQNVSGPQSGGPGCTGTDQARAQAGPSSTEQSKQTEKPCSSARGSSAAKAAGAQPQGSAAECSSSGGVQGIRSSEPGTIQGGDTPQGSTAEQQVPNSSAGGARASQKRQASGKKCAACGKVGRGLKACGRCQRTHFCSHECQRVAWPSHRLVCAPKEGNP